MTYIYREYSYNLTDLNGNYIYEYVDDSGKYHYIKDGAGGYRYITANDVSSTIWTEDFASNAKTGDVIDAIKNADSHKHFVQTDEYWVREGYGVSIREDRFHPDATMIKLDVFEYQNGGKDELLAKSGQHSSLNTKNTTAINNDPLNAVSYGQYVALTNSSATGVGVASQFYANRNGQWIDIGSANTKKNFYVFGKNEINPNTGKYMFKGQDVEFEHIYTMSDDNGTYTGVFLTNSIDEQYFAKKDADGKVNSTDINGSANSLFANVDYYKGAVYGYHNEILITGYSDLEKKWLTAWGAEYNDPNATIENMTVRDFNAMWEHESQENNKLANADIEYVGVVAGKNTGIINGTGTSAVSGHVEKGGSINLVNKAGNQVPGLLVEYGGGIGNVDTYVTFSDTGAYEVAIERRQKKDDKGNLLFETDGVTPIEEDVHVWKKKDNVEANSIKLYTGSKVEGNNYVTSGSDDYKGLEAGTGPKSVLSGLTINGQAFNVDSITGFDLDYSSDAGELVATITTSSGHTFKDSINVGDFKINYEGGDTSGGNGGGTTGGTTINNTIEASINHNYELIDKGWNVGVVNGAGNQAQTNKVAMGDGVNFTSSDNNLVFGLAINEDINTGVTTNTIDVKLSDNISVENITTQKITLGDDVSNQTTIQYNHTDNRITYGDTNNNTYQVANLNDGLTFAGDTGSAEVDLNKQVKIYGGATEYATGKNIGVVASSDDENGAGLEVKLAKDLTGIDSIQVNNSITVGDIKINNGGKITNVQEGDITENSYDVVVGKQLHQTNQEVQNVSNRLDRLGNRVDKVGAGAAALAALHPLDFDPDDKLQFSAGVGNYRGETAAALGAFYRPTEKVMFSVAGTMGNDDNMVSAGITFALDRKNNVSNSRVAMAHEIQDLRDQVAALTALVSQIAGKGNPLLDTVMFPDVPENHWAYDYVESLQKRGIIEGYPDGNFAGDRSMTRYEYAAMLYRALEKGFPVDGRLLKEFEAELGRIRIDRIKGEDNDANKVERVRVNDYEDRDDYGSKLAQVVANAAPAIEEEPAA